MSDGSSGSRKGDSLDTGEAQHGASLEGPGRSGAAHRIPEEDLQEMMRRCSLRADGKVGWDFTDLQSLALLRLSHFALLPPRSAASELSPR